MSSSSITLTQGATSVPKLLTAREAGELLRVTHKTVYELIKRGDIRPTWIGGRIRITEADLLDYLKHARAGES